MSAKDIISGDIVHYSYLWYWQAARGETAGRRDRPVCVQILVSRNGTQIAHLFPITSQPPTGETRALAIPQIEARRVGLDVPAWIVVSEHNEDNWPNPDYIADTKPLGHFSKAFLTSIIRSVIEIVKYGQHKRVDRR